MIDLKYFLLFISTFPFCYVHSQTDPKITEDNRYITCIQCDSLYKQICPDKSIIFGEPEHLAQFPGGEKELMLFIRKQLKYPSECRKKAIQGYVVVKFIVDESGKIICPRIIKSLYPALDNEALRIIKLMPYWEPASNNGIPCHICYTLPVHFKL